MNKSNLINKIICDFEKSSDHIIREYLIKIIKELDLNNSEHPWMREDILNSDTYVCNIKGKRVNLNDIIFGETTTNLGQNIIVITGGKHIGKKAFANKLVEICLNSVEEQHGNLKKKLNKGNYRIPVIIDFEKIFHNKTSALSELIVQTIEMHFEKGHTSHEIILLRDTVKKLLDNGRFLIYIINKEKNISIEEQINSINFCKKEIQNIEKCGNYNNVILLTISSEYDIKTTTLNNSYIITLGELTNEEIHNYIETHIPVLSPLLKKFPNILEIIKYPEHLKMFEQLSNKEMLNDNGINFSNEFELYDFFITQHIRKELQHNTKNNEINIPRENKIKESLKTYTWERLLGVNNTKDPSRYFSFDSFKKIGILDNNGSFVFPYIQYYLIATYIADNIKKGCDLAIPNNLLEEPLNTSLEMVSKMLNKQFDFECFWDLLCKNSDCKINLLVRISKQSQFYKQILNRLYKQIFDNLTRDFYDYTTIEALDNLENNGIDYLNSRYLRLEGYSLEEKNNVKKRYVYFLGISGNGIINEMIDELLEPDTDLHLKYHIIRAMVECYNIHEKSTAIIEKRLDEVSEKFSGIEDPIIGSDFNLLYTKVRNLPWTTQERISSMKNSLKDELCDEIYWKRAHAAGAIGRSKTYDAYNILIEQLNRELNIIYNTKDDLRKNSIKVISYTVEAICELQEHNDVSKEQVIADMLKTVNINRLGDVDIEDAYSTIITGIEYIINPEPDKLPFNLGGRFRNNLIDHKKVLTVVLQKLASNEDICDEVSEDASNKLKQLEKVAIEDINDEIISEELIKDKIKILQITDLHKFDDSSDNNLILHNLKENIKDVDILVVTGDLKNHGEKYDNALNKLNIIVNGLNLSKNDVFIVPGNHDSYDYDGKSEDISEIRKNIYDNKECYLAYIDNLYRSFEDYKKFLIEFYEGTKIEKGGIYNKLHLWKGRINILTMNTSLLCDNNSEQKKIVDILELTKLEKNNNLPTVCISHHDIEQIYEDHKDIIKAISNKLKISAFISGDVHRSDVKPIQLPDCTIPNYICGKLSNSTEDKWSDSNIVIYEVDLKEKILIPKLYKWEKGNYVPDMNFMEKDDKNIDTDWKFRPIELRS